MRINNTEPGSGGTTVHADGNNPQLRYYKICRYNHTPASYSQVHDVLANQNYQVFEAGNNPNANCPAGMQQNQP